MMSETNQKTVNQEQVFAHESPKKIHKGYVNTEDTALFESPNNNNNYMQSLRSSIDSEVIPTGETLKQNTKEKYVTQHQHYITKNIKNDAYVETINLTRNKLDNRYEKTLSTIIHKKHIEQVCDFASYTIARPSGLLGGGILAFFGSLIILLASRYIGFAVPSSVFAIFFVLGFFIGLGVEIIINKIIFRKNKNKLLPY